MPKKYTCCPCGEVFKTLEDYLKHTCKKTGFTPRDIEHVDATSGGRFSKVSASALARGQKRKKDKEKK